MTDLAKAVAALPPEKREQLLQKLREHRAGPDPRTRALPELVSRPEERHRPFPLTDVQEAYWLGRSGYFDLGTVGTNIYMEFEVAGADGSFVGRLARAARALAARHEMLRAVILPDGRQRILPEAPLYEIDARSLRGRADADVESELAALRDRLRLAKAPAERWPLFEIAAVLLDGERVRLLLRVDTLLIDGTSRKAFVRELFGLVQDPEWSLPPVACSYRDYATTWDTFQEGDGCLEARQYWSRRIPELAPPPSLPLSAPIGPQTRARLETRHVTLLAPQAWAALKQRATARNVTPSATVIAAFAEVLGGACADPQFTLGLIGSYRPPLHPAIDTVMGNFNTISLLSVDDAAEGFADRVARTQRQIMVGLNHEDYSGFRVLREAKRGWGRLSRAGAPVLFNSLLHHIRPSPARADAPAEPPPGGAPLPVTFVEASVCIPQVVLLPTVVEVGDGSLHCTWQSTTELFPPGFTDGLADAYQRRLEVLAVADDRWETSARTWTIDRPSRHAATEPEDAGESNRASAAPARTEDEITEALAALWSDVLGTTPAPDDDFCAVGGNSLLAVRLLTRIEQAFGGALPLDILSRPFTVASLAERLRESRAERESTPI